MPVTIVEKLPLPSLKVYTAGSVLLLSASIYYALSVTSDPGWRVNATLQRQVAIAERDGDTLKMVTIAPHDVAANGTRNFTEQFVELMSFMMQEPLCMWSVINAAYCLLALLGFLIQRLVFGKLRVSEAQRVKDKFWNYVFYKFIFVFGVINVQFMDEVLLWCTWFTLVGSIHLLGQLCKDRFEYLSSSPNTSRWAHIRLLSLLGCILAGSAALLAVAAAWGLPAGRNTFAFMAAECVLVVISALHVVARYMLQAYEADAAGPVAYYTHLVFDCTSLCVELANVVHMVVWSNMLVSMASLVLLMQLRHLLHELQARGRRHRLYTALATHMSRNYPMASKEEVEQNQDNCAICWEPMKEARKLPCSHLFHNSCLCQWVQQDASCPTCRRALRAGSGPRAAPGQTTRPHPNHLFHFDGSRYVSWLPSFSVEVTRVRAEPPPPLPSHLDAMATQVQQMFPNYPLGALVADLASTRSAELTVENILEGRLPLPRVAPPPPLDTQTIEAPRDEIRELAALAPTMMSAGTATATASASIATTSAAGTATAGTPLATTSAVYDHYGPEPEIISNQFAEESTERETMLRCRKEQLLAAARRRYLSRARAAHS